jgi:hypothetical protein
LLSVVVVVADQLALATGVALVLVVLVDIELPQDLLSQQGHQLQ